MKRKRSYWSIWVRWNLSDVKMSFCLISLSLLLNSFYKHGPKPNLSFFTSPAGRLVDGETG